ncbi:MAG: ABC transporter permease [Burkholderiaceae bacterium]|nr:ABC transporter permease [Burkholderiaceae bacterium]
MTPRWLPLLSVLGWLLAWEALVRVAQIPHYTLPAPSLVLQTLMDNFGSLSASWWFTLKITFGALALASIGGVLIAAMFVLSAPLEALLLPLAVVLQVTPIVAIAPLMLIYVESTTAALLLCAWIVAFFPILSNTTLGLNSVDRNLRDLFKLNGATRWQELWHLRLPAAMPYFLGGLKIAGGLALIGAVVAEFVAGSAGQSSGLASRIIESGYRLRTARLFAALILISLTGIVIFMTLTWISHMMLRRWHESALKQER